MFTVPPASSSGTTQVTSLPLTEQDPSSVLTESITDPAGSMSWIMTSVASDGP